jgi:hypothetical protein
MMFSNFAATLVVAISAALSAQRPLPPALVGSYEAARVNRQPLPMADRVLASPGYEHAVRLNQMVLTLRGDRRFVAMVRYHHSMVKTRAKAEATPLLTESVRGRYEIQGTSIRMFPDADSKGRRVKPLTGTVSGRRITIPIDYKSGTLTRRFVVDLDRNENIW